MEVVYLPEDQVMVQVADYLAAATLWAQHLAQQAGLSAELSHGIWKDPDTVLAKPRLASEPAARSADISS